MPSFEKSLERKTKSHELTGEAKKIEEARRKEIRRQLNTSLAGVLEPAGFRMKGNLWSRASSDSVHGVLKWDVIDVRRYSLAHQFIINAGKVENSKPDMPTSYKATKSLQTLATDAVRSKMLTPKEQQILNTKEIGYLSSGYDVEAAQKIIGEKAQQVFLAQKEAVAEIDDALDFVEPEARKQNPESGDLPSVNEEKAAKKIAYITEKVDELILPWLETQQG